MKKKILLVCMALLSLLGAKATIMPITSTAGAEVWYHIKLSRGAAANEIWMTGAADGGQIKAQLFSMGDEQLWKVVENGTGLALVNKAFGTYVNSDRDWTGDSPNSQVKAIATPPTRPLQMILSLIVPNAVCIANADATMQGSDYDYATLKFLLYATVSQGGPIGYNNNTWNHSSVNFLTIKDMLMDAITTAEAALNSSSEGLNPGQVSPDDRTALSLSIDLAQTAYDNASATDAEYKSAMDDLNSILALFQTKVILPELSDNGADNWYYIQGTRPANTYMTAGAAGAGTQVKDLAVIPDDTQLWRLVTNGDGFAMQNKATLEYMQTDFPDGTNLSTQTDMPTKALRFITSTETYNKAFRFWIESTSSATEPLRLHAGGSGNGWGVMNWMGDATDNCTWLFLSYDELFRSEFAAAKVDARTAYTTSLTVPDGTEFGQFSTTLRTEYLALLEAEEAKDIATMSQSELMAGTKLLRDAIEKFKCNGDVSNLATAAKYKWFRLINNPLPSIAYSYGKAMSSNGRTLNGAGAAGKYTFETVDVNSDAQLFRFVLNAEGTAVVSIVNKATGYDMGTNGAIVELPVADNTFAITALDINSFLIKPKSAGPLHAAQSGTEILNYDTGAGGASAWKFEFVKSEPKANLGPIYIQTRTDARAYYNNTEGGNEYTQFPLGARNSFNLVITTEEAKDAATMSEQDFYDGIVALEDANKAYTASLNTTPDAAKWYTLESVKVPGKFLSVDPATNAITCEAKNTSDNQKFRFVSKPAHGAFNRLYEISCKAVPTGSIRCEEAAWNTVYNTGLAFSTGATAITLGYWPWNLNIAFGVNGIQTLLQSLDGDGVATTDGSAIINAIESYGGSSAWKIVPADGESAINGPSSNSDIKITVKNRMIVVSGSDAPVKAFTVSGIAVNATKALYPGVYLVKVNNVVKKVVVE